MEPEEICPRCRAVSGDDWSQCGDGPCPMRETEFWFRYEDRTQVEGYLDVDGDYVFTGSRVEVVLWTHQVYRRTPKGAWVHLCVGFHHHQDFHEVRRDLKFVNLSANKRYALPTKEEAWESFQARKKRQIMLLKSRLDRAEKALNFPLNKVRQIS